MNKIEVLDCTIRDGGYVNDWRFTEEQIRECYNACSLSGVDYMEIGFRNLKTKKNLDSFGDTYFCDEEYINRVTNGIDGCKLAVMVTINAFDFNDFVPKEQSKISLIRVLMAYHGAKNGDDNILDIISEKTILCISKDGIEIPLIYIKT